MAIKKEKAKKTILIGVEDNFSEVDRAFFEARFNVKTYSFSHILKSRTGLHFLFFGGGSDVSPELYNEEKGSKTHTDPERDALCSQVFQQYMGTPKLGICRGSQLLTALSGGKLIQHVEGHATGKHHNIEAHFEGVQNPSTFKITSTHHQMMYPFNLDNHNYNLLGWTKVSKSMVYLNGKNKQMELPAKFVEPEIIYYPQTASLAIQGHPEFPDCEARTKDFCLDLIENYLL